MPLVYGLIFRDSLDLYISLKVEHSVPALLLAPPPLMSTCSAWHL